MILYIGVRVGEKNNEKYYLPAYSFWWSLFHPSPKPESRSHHIKLPYSGKTDKTKLSSDRSLYLNFKILFGANFFSAVVLLSGSSEWHLQFHLFYNFVNSKFVG